MLAGSVQEAGLADLLAGFGIKAQVLPTQSISLQPELPIIGQTAHVLQEERERCLANGMVDQLSKPIDPDELIGKIRRYGDGRHRAPPPGSNR